jgi:2-C-methyl-D-erythritol 4-phosphate cytidylyltransferase
MNKYVIIVAGGSGTRMGAEVSKQYLPIGNKTILMHTLEKFHQTVPDAFLTLVIPANDFDFWNKLCQDYQFDVPHQLIAGGNTRFQSVKNGLAAIQTTAGIVAIHDGVRPFVSPEVIKNSFEVAQQSGSAIAVVPLKDSIRKVEWDGNSKFKNRKEYRLVQTPQTFHLQKIKIAFEVEENDSFTDDATVYEYQGHSVELIEGNFENIKITTPEDLLFAEFLLTKDR